MNKLKITIYLLFFLTVNLVFAQRVDIGLELASNVNPINNNNNLGQNYKLGLHSGLKAQIQLKNNFYLTTGLAFTQKSKYKENTEISSLTSNLELLFSLFSAGNQPLNIDSIADEFGLNTDIIKTTKSSITINHLELPILATYQYKKIQVHVGGYASVLLSANRKIEERQDVPLLKAIDINQLDSTGLSRLFLPKAEDINYEESKNTSDLKVFDVGAIIGISYFVNRLNFGLFYTRGFVDYEFNATKAFSDSHQSLRFSLSYLINLKKEESGILLN